MNTARAAPTSLVAVYPYLNDGTLRKIHIGARLVWIRLIRKNHRVPSSTEKLGSSISS